MSKQNKNFKNIQEALAPKIYPLGWVLKYDPPKIGMIYRRNPKEKKKHLYEIHLNNLIFLTSGEDITKQIFYEHPHYLNPNFINPEQVLHLIMKLLEYKNQRMKELAEFMEKYQEDEDPQLPNNEEIEEGDDEYQNLTDKQYYELYKHQLLQQNQNHFNQDEDNDMSI